MLTKELNSVVKSDKLKSLSGLCHAQFHPQKVTIKLNVFHLPLKVYFML